MKDGYLDFDEYIVASEPHKSNRRGSSDKCVGEAAVRIAHLRNFVHGRKYAEARKR